MLLVSIIKGWLEKSLRLPVSSSILGSFLRVSDRGLTEKSVKGRHAVIAAHTAWRKAADDIAKKLTNGKKIDSEQIRFWNQLPAMKQRDSIERAAHGKDSPFKREWLRAKNNAERAAVLKAFGK